MAAGWDLTRSLSASALPPLSKSSGGGEEETREKDTEEQAKASPESSGALQPSCKSIKSASCGQSNAGRARHTNAPADHDPISGEPENRRLREARLLLEVKQAAEAESWSPSVITSASSDWVDLKRFDGTSISVGTKRSGCLMYLLYDPHSGDVRPIQIDSVRVKRTATSAVEGPPAPASNGDVAEAMQDVCGGAVSRDLPGGTRGSYNGSLPEGIEEIDMSYSYVYSTRSAIRNCEQEADRETTRTDQKGNIIVSRHRGRKFLRTVGQQGKLIYHIGDIGHKTSRGGLGMHNVVGRIAWLTAAYLIGDDNGKKDLCGNKAFWLSHVPSI